MATSIPILHYMERMVDSVKHNVKCKSGLHGWQGRLHEVYNSLDEFEAYCNLRQIHIRLGFTSITRCWEANPVVQGSVNPSDLRRVELKRYPRDIVIAHARKMNTKANARKLAQVDFGPYTVTKPKKKK